MPSGKRLTVTGTIFGHREPQECGRGPDFFGLAQFPRVMADWMDSLVDFDLPMKSWIGSFEAKTHLPALLERVARGERITITKHGKPVAQLVPVEPETKPDVKAVVEAMRAFRDKNGPVLGEGLTVRDLIEE